MMGETRTLQGRALLFSKSCLLPCMDLAAEYCMLGSTVLRFTDSRVGQTGPNFHRWGKEERCEVNMEFCKNDLFHHSSWGQRETGVCESESAKI
jgi:hypothetical protein